MIVQASVISRFLECYATSAANLRGAKQRKKVRFTTAFGGAEGGANWCFKHPHLERAFSLIHNILHSIKTDSDSYICRTNV